MIFFIIDFFSKKITDLKRSHRKNPRKLKIIFMWITLIILVTILFYYLGAFSAIDNNNIPLVYKNDISDENLEIYNPLMPKILNGKSSDIKSSIDSKSFSDAIKLMPAKSNSSIKNSINSESFLTYTKLAPTEGNSSLINSKSKFKLLDSKMSSFDPTKISKINQNVSTNKINSKNLENNLFRNTKSSKNSEYKIINDVLLNLRNAPKPHNYQLNEYNFE